MFQPPPSRTTDLVKMDPTSKLWTASMEAAAASGGSAVAPYQSSLCYPGANSFIQPHQYHHPKAAEDMNTYQQNYYQSWPTTGGVTSPATASPIHVNYIMNSNVIHNYHAPQHYSYPPQSFQVCTIYICVRDVLWV